MLKNGSGQSTVIPACFLQKDKFYILFRYMDKRII